MHNNECNLIAVSAGIDAHVYRIQNDRSLPFTNMNDNGFAISIAEITLFLFFSNEQKFKNVRQKVEKFRPTSRRNVFRAV